MATEDDLEAAEESPSEKFISAERLAFFSDAVVAIAMTLLALELPIPTGDTNRTVLHSFNADKGQYIAFLISFAVVATHWSGHHRIFGYVTKLGGRLAYFNFLWLLMVVITPFATRVLTGDGGFQVRFITYATVQMLTGLFFMAMVYQMQRHNLLHPETPPRAISHSYWRLAVMIAAFGVSIPVSFFTQAAYACWILMPFAIRLVISIAERRPKAG